MGIGSGGNIGSMGANPFSFLAVDLEVLLSIHGLTMTVTRLNQSSLRDIYGQPTGPPITFSATLLVVEQTLKEVATVAGGKAQEQLWMVGQPGTLLENDVVAFNGHNYDVQMVTPNSVDGGFAADTYMGVREVDV